MYRTDNKIMEILNTTSKLEKELKLVTEEHNHRNIRKVFKNLMSTAKEYHEEIDSYWEYNIFDEADEDIRLTYEELIEAYHKIINDYAVRLLDYISHNVQLPKSVLVEMYREIKIEQEDTLIG